MRILLVIAFLLALSPVAHASLVNWNIDVTLNSDKTTDWVVDLIYNETIAKTDYFILGKISSYEVFADNRPLNCTVDYEIGSSITCSNIDTNHVTYKIKTASMINDIQQNFRIFPYKFLVTRPTDEFKIIVRLPLGAVLADPQLLETVAMRPFTPSSGKEGSDGRNILVEWNMNKPLLGSSIDVTVVYEQLSEKSELPLFGAIVVAFIIIVLVLLAYIRRGREHEILPVLTAGERKVVEILLREKNDVDQRQIVKETDLSKATISRLISNLASRGVVEKVSKGRKNLIRLKKTIKRKEIMDSKEGEKRG